MEPEIGMYDYAPSMTGIYEDDSVSKFSVEKLYLTVDDEEIIIAMQYNTAVDAFIDSLTLEGLSLFDLSTVKKFIERLEESLYLVEETGYHSVSGEMVTYRPWGIFTIFYEDFRYFSEFLPLENVESSLNIIASHTKDFTSNLKLMKNVEN